MSDTAQTICEFCGSVQPENLGACAGCGANLNPGSNLTKPVDRTVVPALAFAQDVIKQSHREHRRSRILLTSAALCLAVLLGVYWQMSRSPNAQLEENSVAEIQPPGSNITAVASPLFAAYETTREQYVLQARLGSVLGLIAPLRTQLMIYFQEQGQWPSSLAELGHNGQELTDGKNILSVRLGVDGQLLVSLSGDFGNDSHLSIKPRLVMAGTSVLWDCETNVTLTLELPGDCTYNDRIVLADSAQ